MPDVLIANGLEMLRDTLPKIARGAALYRGDNPGTLITAEGVAALQEQIISNLHVAD
jgi:hypothetical protein